MGCLCFLYILLIIALCDSDTSARSGLPEGFYVFLRIIVCATSVCWCFFEINYIVKFFLIIQAVLFNPVFQIHLKHKDDWIVFDISSLLFLLVLGVYFVTKNYHKRLYDVNSLSKKYKPYTIRDYVTVLKPKYRDLAFCSPKEVKQYLDSIGLDETSEKDAWIFYHLAEKAVKDRTVSKKEKEEIESDNKIILSLIKWLKDTGYSELDYRHISPLDHQRITAESLVFLCKEFKNGFFDLEDASYYCSKAICEVLKEKGTLEKTLRPKKDKWIESNGMRICVEVDDEDENNSPVETK